MANWWVNVYFIGFLVTCVWLLPTLSGIMRRQYIWRKSFWTVPYESKDDRAAVYGTTLFGAFVWPITWVLTILVFIAVFLHACLFRIFKKLR